MSIFKTAGFALITASVLALSACGGDRAETPKTATPQAPVKMTSSQALDKAIASPHRADDAQRDAFRHPKGTLEFFGVKPGMHVAEVWPGWYTEILAPYAKMTDGQYTAILYPESMGENAMKRVTAFKEKFGDTDRYGNISHGAFGQDHGAIMPAESADMILTFRNVHNWMGRGYAEEAFREFYAALKPGGILGVVEHRLPESAEQDPTGSTGYVQESYMKALAKEAGFEFVESSEVNANPRDTADHPFGVWTLPPRSRMPKEGDKDAEEFNAEQYKAIGESDRATLKFRKPG